MAEELRRAQAAAFLALHHGTVPLVIPNVWDGGSARIMEQAGFPVLATTSAGTAFVPGVDDPDTIAALAARIPALSPTPTSNDDSRAPASRNERRPPASGVPDTRCPVRSRHVEIVRA